VGLSKLLRGLGAVEGVVCRGLWWFMDETPRDFGFTQVSWKCEVSALAVGNSRSAPPNHFIAPTLSSVTYTEREFLEITRERQKLGIKVRLFFILTKDTIGRRRSSKTGIINALMSGIAVFTVTNTMNAMFLFQIQGIHYNFMLASILW
jgi:hypothetical protein